MNDICGIKRQIAPLRGFRLRDDLFRRAAPHSRQSLPRCVGVKAESLLINSVGHRPTNWNVPPSAKPCKGVIRISPLRGLARRVAPDDRAMPYPNDYKAFSLSLTAMRHRLALLTYGLSAQCVAKN